MSIMKFIFRVAMSIPILPAMGSIFTNRRDPTFKLCAIADVVFNVSDWFYSWTNRLPKSGQAAIMRDNEGRVSGSINRLP